MPQDDQHPRLARTARPSLGPSVLAQDAVSLLTQRQARTPLGARQFIVDHLLRAVLHAGEFNPDHMIEELRGHRLSVDSVIDLYVPTVARLLGEMWQADEINFASVTVATMRLQSILSLAATDVTEVSQVSETSLSVVIAIPLGEQHTLGAFVLAAQLRRLGARVDISFCETGSDFVSRVICAPPDAVLFSASSRGTLETVSQLVLEISRTLEQRPILVLGGSFKVPTEMAKDISGVDLVTNQARDAVSLVLNTQNTIADRASR